MENSPREFHAVPFRRPPLDLVSQITKRNVARVNKAWYALASPFLYEHIILGRSKVLQPLLEGMNRSAKTAHGELSRPIGWWTQRLDVNMRDKPNRNPQIEMNALAGILTHLPNLRILTFSITGHRYRETLPSNVLHSLVCRDTLRIVHWYTPHFPSIESLSALLEDHLHLESVNANEIMNTSIPQIQLNSLNTIHVRWPGFITMETPAFISYVWALDLPAVRYATYNLEFSVNNDLLVVFGIGAHVVDRYFWLCVIIGCPWCVESFESGIKKMNTRLQRKAKDKARLGHTI